MAVMNFSALYQLAGKKQAKASQLLLYIFHFSLTKSGFNHPIWFFLLE